MLDLGASINLIPLSMLKKIGDVEVRPTRMTLQLADCSIKHPYGIVEDLLVKMVKMDKFLFPLDFVVMDIKVPLILGRPLMKTIKVMIDVDKGKLKVCVQGEEMSFDVFVSMKHPKDTKECYRLDVLDKICNEQSRQFYAAEHLIHAFIHCREEVRDWKSDKLNESRTNLEDNGKVQHSTLKELEVAEEVAQAKKSELKQLPAHPKYAFMVSQ